MTLYYKCKKCGWECEIQVKSSKDKLDGKNCPKCGIGELQRAWSINIKGDGNNPPKEIK